MANINDEIENINYELSRIQKNKATENYIGYLHARIARIKEKQESGGGGGSKGIIYNVKKQGDATVAFVGFPSVGKSTLLNSITNAESKVTGHQFTTLRPIPGMLKHKNALIQLIDAPGIIEGASVGKGMGRQIISALRTADLILMLIEPDKNQLPVILNELYNAGVRLDLQPPNIIVKKTIKGGLTIESTVKQDLSTETFEKILGEFSYSNAYVILKERLTMDRFIDGLVQNRVYIPSLLVVTKTDKFQGKALNNIKKKFPKAVYISAEKGTGLDSLKDAIWASLGFKRIYMKEQGRDPDYNDPLIMRGLVTIEAVAKKVRKIASSAKIWGKSAKHEGQIVGLKHELNDEDVVTLDIK